MLMTSFLSYVMFYLGLSYFQRTRRTVSRFSSKHFSHFKLRVFFGRMLSLQNHQGLVEELKTTWHLSREVAVSQVSVCIYIGEYLST
mmetsp:Transcript_11924/g.15469  ORF Transcript_11924/g.15469 Transcript_11924/m.15469 type:complete len:87 (+) Transcript_11924:1058-1318(+)